MIKILSLFSLLILLTGCPTTGGNLTLGTSGTRYATHEFKGNERGNILVLHAKQSFEGQLVHDNYIKLVSKYLASNGLTPVVDDKNLKYVGILNYGFLSNRGATMPRTIKVGNKSFNINPEDLISGTPIGIPSGYIYGVPTKSEYDRVIELDIYDVSLEKPKQVFTSKVVSRGSCGAISQLSDILVPLLLENFPPKSGEVERIINWDIKVAQC